MGPKIPMATTSPLAYPSPHATPVRVYLRSHGQAALVVIYLVLGRGFGGCIDNASRSP